jgi:hypothetical protein
MCLFNQGPIGGHGRAFTHSEPIYVERWNRTACVVVLPGLNAYIVASTLGLLTD